jgi:hypothetical protein
MRFKQWLLDENSSRTGAKLGLYPSLMDALGQYPPLYGTPTSADLITYIYIQFGKKGVPGKNGIIKYSDEHAPRGNF